MVNVSQWTKAQNGPTPRHTATENIFLNQGSGVNHEKLGRGRVGKFWEPNQFLKGKGKGWGGRGKPGVIEGDRSNGFLSRSNQCSSGTDHGGLPRGGLVAGFCNVCMNCMCSQKERCYVPLSDPDPAVLVNQFIKQGKSARGSGWTPKISHKANFGRGAKGLNFQQGEWSRVKGRSGKGVKGVSPPALKPANVPRPSGSQNYWHALNRGGQWRTSAPGKGEKIRLSALQGGPEVETSHWEPHRE